MKQWIWPCAGFVVATLAIGVRYWTVSYSDLDLPTSIPGWALLSVAAIAAALRAGTDTPAWAAWVAPAAALPAAICARIAVEVTLDPTSHNLWPFEVVIGLVIGSVIAGVGLGVGEAVRRIGGRSVTAS